MNEVSSQLNELEKYIGSRSIFNQRSRLRVYGVETTAPDSTVIEVKIGS